MWGKESFFLKMGDIVACLYAGKKLSTKRRKIMIEERKDQLQENTLE